MPKTQNALSRKLPPPKLDKTMDFLSPYDILDHISKNCDMPPPRFSQNKTFFLEWGNTFRYSIQLVVDYPSKYKDEMMHILDLNCWVEKRGKVVK